MKVLMVLGLSTGGIGAHVDRLAADLRAQGHDVIIATAAQTAAAFGWADARRLWPVHRGLRAPLGLVDWHLLKNLAGTVDVIHAHGHQAAFVAAVAVARAKPRPELVVSLHNELPQDTTRTVAGRLIGWAIGRAQLVTGASEDLVALARRLGARRAELAEVASPAVSELLTLRTAQGAGLGGGAGAQPKRDLVGGGAGAQPKRDLVAGDGGARGKRDLVGDGAGAQANRDVTGAEQERVGLRAARAELGVDLDKPLVLTVARIAPQKDLPTLAAAARALRTPATWVLVGGGDERLRASLERELSGIPLQLVGPRRDVTTWLRAADVFVLTSRWEARALVVQEAMAAGLPVVTTDTGGLPELVGDAGVLVPVGDAAAVAAAVDGLLADEAQRRRLGSAARERAATWATPEQEARRWVERYTTALRA